MDFIKEIFRIGLLALLSYLLTEGVITNLVEIFTIDYKLDLVVKTQIVGILTMILKALDRWLHESKIAEKGITRF